MDQLHLQLADAEARLKAALVAGSHTAGIRQEISSIRALIARAADDTAAVQAETEAAEHEVIAQRAELIAAEASDRLANKLAALSAPEHP